VVSWESAFGDGAGPWLGAFEDLARVGFRTTAALAAAVSVAFIPLALRGRRFEPSRKSLELASGDQLLAVPTVGLADPGVARGAFRPVSPLNGASAG
jgi:hypothetical protein